MGTLEDIVAKAFRNDWEADEMEEAMKLSARVCPHCDAVFVPGDKSQRYCKLACYQEASR